MTKLEQLSHDSFYNMQNYSQITIDFIQEAEDIIEIEWDNEEDKGRELGGLSYKISTVFEVLNPALKTDKEALLKLIEIIEDEIHINKILRD